MDGTDKDFYITVAIDYPNGDPHLGHAYEKVAADAIARYQVLRGRRPFYLMGNDEHSQNVLRAAKKVGMETEAYCAAMADVFRGAWDALGVRYDAFMRTSDPRHIAAVTEIVQRLYDTGHVYRGIYRGWYCVSCEAFKTAKELEDGNCPVHHRPVEAVEETNYFFRLSAFADRIAALIAEHPEFIQPESRRNEVLAVLKEGLEDISISRSRSEWGVPVPWDPDQVVYVWFDALITYLSGAGFGWDPEGFARRWPADLHLIGKDIIRFHCIIWPAMLMGAGLALPRTVYAHGFLNVRGERLSKSAGNIVDPVRFREVYGLDATRYYLLVETPFGQDGNFAPESFVKRYNSDLANDLGNLLHRTVAMIERFAEGRVPPPTPGGDDGFADAAAAAVTAMAEAMDGLALNEAPAALLTLCARANRYVDRQAPWNLAKRGQTEQLHNVLYNLAESLRILAVGFSPFLVEAPAEMLRQLGCDPSEMRWEDLRWGGLVPGTPVRKGAALFQRLDPEVVLADVASFGVVRPAAPPVAAPAPEPESPRLSIDDFRRLQLRVATIRSAERVAGADRLLRLEVDLGAEQRQIVAGIARHYAPEDLPGRQVVIVANLEPATIRGVRSEGMLLAASDGDQLTLVSPERLISPGSTVR